MPYPQEGALDLISDDNLGLTKCWATLLLAPSCRDESLGLPTQGSHFGGHLMVAGSSQVHTSPWLLGVMLNASFISFLSGAVCKDLAPGIHSPSFSLLKEEVFHCQVSGVLSQMIVLLTPVAFLGASCSSDFR